MNWRRRARGTRPVSISLCHTTRTPLNAVVLAAQLLEIHFDGGVDDEVQTCLRTIRHSVRNVLDLLGDLLNLSKIDAGAQPAEISQFPVELVLAECVASIEPQAKVKGLDVRLEPGLPGRTQPGHRSIQTQTNSQQPTFQCLEVHGEGPDPDLRRASPTTRSGSPSRTRGLGSGKATKDGSSTSSPSSTTPSGPRGDRPRAGDLPSPGQSPEGGNYAEKHPRDRQHVHPDFTEFHPHPGSGPVRR